MWPAAQTLWPLPSGRQRTSRIRTSGRPSWSASQSVEASSSGRASPPGVRGSAGAERPAEARTSPISYGAWSPRSCPTPRSWRRSGRRCPALGAGIYLNTGSVGPLPAETAAAMAELVELRAPDRPRASPTTGRPSSSGWPRRAAPSRRSSAPTSTRSRITHSTTEGDERRDLVGRLAARRPGRHDAGRASGRPRAGPSRPRARFGAEVAIADVGDGGDDDATLAAFDAAITARDAARRALARPVDDRGRLPVGRIAGARPRPRRAGRRRRRPGGRGDPGLASPISASTSTRSPARSGCSGPEGTGALWASRAIVARARPSRTSSWFTLRADRRPTEARSAGRTPAGSRTTDYYQPGGHRVRPELRLAVDVRRAAVDPRARPGDGAASRADRLAAIAGVELLTPRDRMATLVTFRIAGWDADDGARRAGRPDLRDRPDDPAARRAPDQRRLLHDRGRDRAGRDGGRAARRPHARDAAAAAAADDPRPGRWRVTPRRPGEPRRVRRARRRSEIRWRQFRNAPRPVVRAVLSSLVVAIVLGLGYLAYDVALRRGAVLPGGDLRDAVPASSTSCRPRRRAASSRGSSCPQPRGSGDATTALAVERGARASSPPCPSATSSSSSSSRCWSRCSADRERVAGTAAVPAAPLRCHAPAMGMAHSYHSAVLSGRYHPVGRVSGAAREDSFVAIDEQHVALPKLYGAPAYARPPRLVVGDARARSTPTTCRSRRSRPTRSASSRRACRPTPTPRAASRPVKRATGRRRRRADAPPAAAEPEGPRRPDPRPGRLLTRLRPTSAGTHAQRLRARPGVGSPAGE